MPIPQVTDRIKGAPAIALRALFAGVGQLLLAADKIRNRAVEQVIAHDRGTAPDANGAARPEPTPESPVSEGAAPGNVTVLRQPGAGEDDAAQRLAAGDWSGAAAAPAQDSAAMAAPTPAAQAAKATPAAGAAADGAPSAATAKAPPSAKPASPKPAAAKPAAAKPAAAKSAAAKPEAAKPAASRSAVTRPSAKPATAKPTAGRPVTAKPATAKPGPAKPSAAKPSAAKPTAVTKRPGAGPARKLAAVADQAESAPPAAGKPQAAGRSGTAGSPAGSRRAAAAGEPPIAGYDELSVASLRARMRFVDEATVRDMLAYEKAHAGREVVTAMFERRLAKLGDGTA